MLKSSYSDAYIFLNETITVAALVAGSGNNNIQVVFENCAPFTNCISEINNTQIDNAKDMGLVMSMYSLIEQSNNYSKTSGSLWQYYRDEPILNNNYTLVNFPSNSVSFKFKQKITDLTRDDGIKAVQVMVALKYLNNFWRTLEMPLINCEINLSLTQSSNFVISNVAANQNKTFTITNTKLYVPGVTLSTQDNAKLWQQLKSGFKRTLNWKKFHSKTEPLNAPNPYLDFLIDPSFQGVNKRSV